jgi:hypothetical protein
MSFKAKTVCGSSGFSLRQKRAPFTSREGREAQGHRHADRDSAGSTAPVHSQRAHHDKIAPSRPHCARDGWLRSAGGSRGGNEKGAGTPRFVAVRTVNACGKGGPFCTSWHSIYDQPKPNKPRVPIPTLPTAPLTAPPTRLSSRTTGQVRAGRAAALSPSPYWRRAHSRPPPRRRGHIYRQITLFAGFL